MFCKGIKFYAKSCPLLNYNQKRRGIAFWCTLYNEGNRVQLQLLNAYAKLDRITTGYHQPTLLIPQLLHILLSQEVGKLNLPRHCS